MSALGRCFQESDWADHPEFKGMRACARLDPVHDFDSIGAAVIGLDAVPADCFANVEVPSWCSTAGTTTKTVTRLRSPR